MNFNSKNLAITMILLFLICNHFIGLAWEIVKTVLYCVVFMFLLKQISPELYNYIMQVIDIKNFKFSNIPKTISLIVKKISTLLPFLKCNDEKTNKNNKPKDKKL